MHLVSCWLTLSLSCHVVTLPKGRAAGLCHWNDVLCFLTAGVHRLPDALQLYRVSEDGALAFHPGMDRHFLYFHAGNRKDERGNPFHKRELRRKTVVSYICAWRREGETQDPNQKPSSLKLSQKCDLALRAADKPAGFAVCAHGLSVTSWVLRVWCIFC